MPAFKTNKQRREFQERQKRVKEEKRLRAAEVARARKVFVAELPSKVKMFIASNPEIAIAGAIAAPVLLLFVLGATLPRLTCSLPLNIEHLRLRAERRSISARRQSKINWGNPKPAETERFHDDLIRSLAILRRESEIWKELDQCSSQRFRIY